MRTPLQFKSVRGHALSLLASLALAFGATAASADAVVIENVRVEVGDGTVLENGAVYINGGTIEKVAKTIKAPRGVRVVDGKGGVLTPGLVDVEGTVGVREVSMEESTTDYEDKRSPWTPGFRPALGFDPHSVRIPITRKGGVTRVIVAPDGGVLSGIGTWAPLTGALEDRPSVDDDAALFVSINGGAAHTGKARGALWTHLMDLTEQARLYRAKAKDFDRNALRTLALSPLHLRAFDRALKGEVAFAARVDKAADIIALLEFAQWVKTSSRGKEKLRLVIVGGVESWMLAPRLAKENVAVVIDPMEDGPHEFNRLRTHSNAAGILDKAGVDVILYVSGWFENARRLRQIAGNAVAQGLDRQTAIKAMTQTPAKVFQSKSGARKKRGVIAPGAVADVVLWSADPLELSTTAKVVFINGRAHSLDTRQDALARRYFRIKSPKTKH